MTSTYHPFDVILPYDQVTETAPSNDDVAENLVAPMMERALACKNDGQTCQGSAFFAYGATGSGKTYTMGFDSELIDHKGGQSPGFEVHPGLLQIGMKQIYEELARLRAGNSVKHRSLGKMRVWMSFMELYGTSPQIGSMVFDLLSG